MKTEYDVECKYGKVWSLANTFTSKKKASDAIKGERAYDADRGWKYSYRLVRVTTTREVIKGV